MPPPVWRPALPERKHDLQPTTSLRIAAAAGSPGRPSSGRLCWSAADRFLCHVETQRKDESMAYRSILAQWSRRGAALMLALSLALGVAGAMIPMPVGGCGTTPGPCIVVH